MTFAAVSVTAVALTGTGLPAHADAPAEAAPPAAPVARPGEDLRSITYAGMSVTFPASWPVVDLAKTPRACVRVDRHAVYLGTPAPDQDCPARIQGHTEALLLAPAAALRGTQAGLGAAVADIGTAPALTAQARQLGQFAQTFAAARVTALASFGANPETVQAVLASMKKVSDFPPRHVAPSPAELTDKIDYGKATTGTHYKGEGFDTCASPSTGAMEAWLASPFRSIGIYIGGRNRACLWGNLSYAWVSTVAKMGWRLQPIYVGLQPYCTNQAGMADISKYTTTARAQGRTEGADAVSQGRALGLYQGLDVVLRHRGLQHLRHDLCRLDDGLSRRLRACAARPRLPGGGVLQCLLGDREPRPAVREHDPGPARRRLDGAMGRSGDHGGEGPVARVSGSIRRGPSSTAATTPPRTAA